MSLVESGRARIGGGSPRFDRWLGSGRLRPVAEFVLTFGLWIGLLGVGLAAGSWPLRVALVVPLTLASGQLFTLAHDAGHRSFSSSRLLNEAVGRLALLPSVHVFGLWRAHHDVHHRYTNLRGRDFVWTPTTEAEYRALPPWRRRLHRLFRHSSGIGLGLHYTVGIWARRMLWPRRRHQLRGRARLVADAVGLHVALVGLAVAAWWFVSAVDPHRAADPWSWISATVLLFVLPVFGTHWLIGFVIYLNHTHPDIVWYDDPVEWSRHPVQLEGSVGVRFHGFRHLLYPRRIMNHTVHHLDPRVPLRSLDPAQRNLLVSHGDVVVWWDWSWSRFHEILRCCKLYDYDRQRWLTYAAVEDPT